MPGKKVFSSSTDEYAGLLDEVKACVRSAQYETLKAVNKGLTSLYWDIGKMIAARQDAYGWGRKVVETLAADLQTAFPGSRGYSAQNLWYMRQFYLTYRDKPKLQPLVGEISWAKNLVIMAGCKNDLEKEGGLGPDFCQAKPACRQAGIPVLSKSGFFGRRLFPVASRMTTLGKIGILHELVIYEKAVN